MEAGTVSVRGDARAHFTAVRKLKLDEISLTGRLVCMLLLVLRMIDRRARVCVCVCVTT